MDADERRLQKTPAKFEDIPAGESEDQTNFLTASEFRMISSCQTRVNMTRGDHNRIKKTTARFFAVLLASYMVWVAIPFNDSVRVHNSAGISEQDVVEVISYARTQGAFSEQEARRLKAESRWTPWKRSFFFIEIEGHATKIGVRAGFIGGPLYGGGPIFSGEKKADGWDFEDRGYWIS